MHVVLKVPCYNRETTHFEGGILDETETNTKTPTGSWESLPQPRKIPPLPFYRSHGRPSPRVVLGTSYLGIQGICWPSPLKKSNKPVLMGYQGTYISGWAQPGEISLGSPAVRPSNSSATLCKVSARHTCRPAQSRSKKRARARFLAGTGRCRTHTEPCDQRVLSASRKGSRLSTKRPLSKSQSENRTTSMHVDDLRCAPLLLLGPKFHRTHVFLNPNYRDPIFPRLQGYTGDLDMSKAKAAFRHGQGLW